MSMQIAALMAGKIQVCGRDSLLTEEPVFFDGMHSHVKYFVSLTLWVFHPGMCCMVILAIMDALKEDRTVLKYSLMSSANHYRITLVNLDTFGIHTT